MTNQTNDLAPVFGLRRAPRIDGPYDDERQDVLVPVVDGSLALAFPAVTSTAVPLRLVPPAGGVDQASDEPVPRGSAGLDPRPLVGPMAQAVAEVLTGFRPPHQLSQVATLDVLAQLERNAGRLAPRGTRTPIRPRVSSLRLCEPRAGVAEIAAVIDLGMRRRALALRLEAPGARWRCTVVRVG
ncbi:MAG TPA: Rv3235 family protein [Mycobacteriales bacterium]|jgi:hypothetical protein|nr:Rv3235 family protein [Mycobacteriales bacterium]